MISCSTSSGSGSLGSELRCSGGNDSDDSLSIALGFPLTGYQASKGTHFPPFAEVPWEKTYLKNMFPVVIDSP